VTTDRQDLTNSVWAGPSQAVGCSRGLSHDRGHKVQRRLIGIVRAPAQLKITRGRPAAVGKRLNVMELQEATLGAPAIRAHRRAAALVARPHRPPHRRGHIVGSRRPSGCVGRSSVIVARRQLGRQI
jgi:hypothetical protein